MLYAVTTPYTWDLVETARRLTHEPICVENISGADIRLPNLISQAADRGLPLTLAPASPTARMAASKLAFEAGYSNPRALVDPTAVIARTTNIAHGVFINASVTIASNVTIGCNVNINRSATLGHDVVISSFASIGPGALVGSYAEISPAAFVGTGAVVLPEVRVGPNCIIGAGAVVTKDVVDSSIVVGNPARVLRYNSVELQEQCPWH